jgi:hypothetical protein
LPPFSIVLFRIRKNAKNMVKATAGETMPHCGMTLAAVRNSFFAKELSAIAPELYRSGPRSTVLSLVDEYTRWNSHAAKWE